MESLLALSRFLR
uniref:Uncharacterized protein n=1 Tax=Rhizophora mucronata TaxID=61149 RepID=A0A2P2PGE4_RHIMU